MAICLPVNIQDWNRGREKMTKSSVVGPACVVGEADTATRSALDFSGTVPRGEKGNSPRPKKMFPDSSAAI